MPQDIAVWLRDYLQEHGETDCEVVRAEAYAEGYSKAELREARLLCMIKPISKTFWKLPEGME
ncbi:MAG: hypothetical protein RSF86_14465 [Angelakisella sp.]